MTSDVLEQIQRLRDPQRDEGKHACCPSFKEPSPIYGMPDSYFTYIIATLTLQCRYQAFLIHIQDVFLSLYRMYLSLPFLILFILHYSILGCNEDCGPFSPIRVYSPLPDKAVYQLYDGLKAYRSLVGETPLWRRCVEDVKKMASLSNNETVILYSMLL